ncbi:MAG: hypothetical protein V4754_03030 [Pseudomonadota bacterium]
MNNNPGNASVTARGKGPLEGSERDIRALLDTGSSHGRERANAPTAAMVDGREAASLASTEAIAEPARPGAAVAVPSNVIRPADTAPHAVTIIEPAAVAPNEQTERLRSFAGAFGIERNFMSDESRLQQICDQVNAQVNLARTVAAEKNQAPNFDQAIEALKKVMDHPSQDSADRVRQDSQVAGSAGREIALAHHGRKVSGTLDTGNRESAKVYQAANLVGNAVLQPAPALIPALFGTGPVATGFYLASTFSNLALVPGSHTISHMCTLPAQALVDNGGCNLRPDDEKLGLNSVVKAANDLTSELAKAEKCKSSGDLVKARDTVDSALKQYVKCVEAARINAANQMPQSHFRALRMLGNVGAACLAYYGHPAWALLGYAGTAWGGQIGLMHGAKVGGMAKEQEKLEMFLKLFNPVTPDHVRRYFSGPLQTRVKLAGEVVQAQIDQLKQQIAVAENKPADSADLPPATAALSPFIPEQGSAQPDPERQADNAQAGYQHRWTGRAKSVYQTAADVAQDVRDFAQHRAGQAAGAIGVGAKAVGAGALVEGLGILSEQMQNYGVDVGEGKHVETNKAMLKTLRTDADILKNFLTAEDPKASIGQLSDEGKAILEMFAITMAERGESTNSVVGSLAHRPHIARASMRYGFEQAKDPVKVARMAAQKGASVLQAGGLGGSQSSQLLGGVGRLSAVAGHKLAPSVWWAMQAAGVTLSTISNYRSPDLINWKNNVAGPALKQRLGDDVDIKQQNKWAPVRTLPDAAGKIFANGLESGAIANFVGIGGSVSRRMGWNSAESKAKAFLQAVSADIGAAELSAPVPRST